MTNLIFFGSDRFSAVVLTELIQQSHTPILVVTDQPKPKGKKGQIEPNEVEKLAKDQDIKVLYYQDNKDELINFIEREKSTGLSASFPHLFPPNIISAFGGQLYNLHPSLLPQYRNVAPGPYALAMGDTVTGISLFPIGIGIDNGELVAQQSEPILPEDTTTSLLTRLFTIGAKLFIHFLANPQDPSLTSSIPVMRSSELIFTRKLTRESGYLEWDIVQKLVKNKDISANDTTNPLIKLRLNHYPDRTKNILLDLIRSLDGYEKVWTKTITKKRELILSLSFSDKNELMILIAGKPKPISMSNFTKIYL